MVIQKEAETAVQRAAGERCGSREMVQRARVVDLTRAPWVRIIHTRLNRALAARLGSYVPASRSFLAIHNPRRAP